MITYVTLKGFQSHVNSTFNLQNGLNVITGPSDTGKTAIIRAVRWVAFNEPQGESFVNENVGEAEVKIHLANNAIITKHRRKGKTTYVVQQDENDEGSIFEKSEVPLEVTRLLGIEKTSFGDFEAALNFSFQLDAPFLISETASAGAKVLGKLAGTESVDLAIKGVSKDTYAARNLRAQAEKDIERITGSLFEYEGIDDVKQSLETAEMILEQVEESHSRLESLKEYRHQYLLARDKIQKLLQILDRLAHVPALEDDLKNIEKSQQRYDQLLQLYSDGSRLQDRLLMLGQDIKKYENVQEVADLVDVLTSEADRLASINILRQSYQRYSVDVKRAVEVLNKTKDVKTAIETINKAENNLNILKVIRNLKIDYQNTSNDLVRINTKLDTFKDMYETKNTLTAVEGDEKRLAELDSLKLSYNKASYNKTLNERLFRTAQNDLQGAHEELQRVWDSAGGVCPLCESAIGDCSHE